MLKKISVLVVDDSTFMRRAISDILKTDPDIEISGTAKNGLEALKMTKILNPDVIIMDIDMPVMDGLTSLRHMMIESPKPTVVLSSMFSDGAVTFEALRLGVVDFVPKPSGAISDDIDTAKQNLLDRIKLAKSVNMSNVRRVRISRWKQEESIVDLYRFRSLDYILAIGTTLSGPNTVMRLLSGLSPKIPASVVVVQEISPKILPSFVRHFDEHVPWKVEVARQDTVLEQGTCYISSTKEKPSIKSNSEGSAIIAFSESQSRPLDLLFSSASEVFQQNTIGVLLTGIGNDGAKGMANIRKVSGVTLAQEAQTCVYPNLTDHAVKCGVIDIVLNEAKLCRTIETIIT
jgi:two-component system, chemotaxis family, protein-glutamate methylesterase/glutaminase